MGFTVMADFTVCAPLVLYSRSRAVRPSSRRTAALASRFWSAKRL